MAEDRRRDIATAATGAVLLGAGGVARHGGVHAAFPVTKPKIHSLGMLRAAKGKKLYFGGSALGALGLAPLAVGTTRAVRGDVKKAVKPRTAQERADRLDRGAHRAHQYSIEQARVGNLAGVRRANRVRNARAGRAAVLWSGMAKADDDKRPGFWREGLAGSKDALRQRASSTVQPVPVKLRAAQLGAGGAAGAIGSLAARAALGRRGDALKPLLTPIAGGLAATGSVPLTNRVVRRHYPDYEVTAAGVRRRKTAPKRPSTKASTYRSDPRSFRADLNKAAPRIPKRFLTTELSGNGRVAGQLTSAIADLLRAENKPKLVIIAAVDGGPGGLKTWRRSQGLAYDPDVRYQWVGKAEERKRYLGARTPYIRQRAAVTAASHPPLVGPFASAALAGRYAPPGQQRKATARQYGLSSVAPLPAAVAGAYGGAHLTRRSKTAEGIATDALKVKGKVESKLRQVAHLPEKKGGGLVARQTARFVGTKAGAPFRTKAGAVGGAAGFLGAKMATGGVGTQTAITLNQRDQRRYNAAHHIEKSEITPGVFRSISNAGPGHRQLIRARVRSSQGKRLSGVGPRQQAERSRGMNESVRGVLDFTRRPTVASSVHRNVHYGTDVSHAHRELIDRTIGARKIKRPVAIHVTDYADQGGGGMATATPGRHHNQLLVSPHLLNDTYRHHTGVAGLQHTIHHELTHAEKRKPGWLAPRSMREDYRGENAAQLREEARADESSYRWHGVTRTSHGGPGEVDRHFQGMQRRLRAQRGTRGRTPIPMGRGDVEKAAGPGQTKREKHTLAQRKRRSAALSTAGGALGLTSLGLLATGHRNPAITAGTIGSGLGGVNALLGARVQRQEARAVDPVRKSDALQLRNSHKQNAELLRRYGDRGPLPKKLDRDTRMKAYEARYVHHGGHKQNAWSRRADAATGIKNAGLAVATAGGGAWLATRGKRGRAALVKHPLLRHHAETVAGAGAVAGGLGEMAAGYAHHRQSSYSHSPGGVAASALRRMRDYTPEGQ